jgi:hypothetical protein
MKKYSKCLLIPIPWVIKKIGQGLIPCYKKLKSNFATKKERQKFKRILAFTLLITTVVGGLTIPPAGAYPDIRMPPDGAPKKDMGLVWTHAVVWFILGCLKKY